MNSVTMKVTAAFDGSVSKEVPRNGAADVESALANAAAIADNPDRQIPVADRKQILRRTIEIMQEREAQFVVDAADEGGKPLVDTRIEIPACAARY